MQNIIWVRYEDLARDPKSEAGRILEFLGLDGAGELMDFDGRWRVHERDEQIRDMNGESIGRLSPDDIRAATQEAEEMLRHFGYEIL